MKGILLVDKPAGITSHDAVDHIRKAAGIRRVGHTGTLDPRATGLLILCLGQATRLSEFLMGLDKVYEGVIRLGVVTDSYDLDGTVTEEHPVPNLTPEQISAAFEEFTGTIDQLPPMVSAVKIGGKRLYALARQGAEVEREPRRVTVLEFTLLDYAPPDVHFRVRCTRGTYARSLAHDVGQSLGCGGVLAGLRRTWVGHHSVEDAQPLDALTTREDVLAHLRRVDDALDLPSVIIRRQSQRTLRNGGAIGLNDMQGECPVDSGWVQMKAESGELLALGEVAAAQPGVLIRPKRVLGGGS